jgi:hypothetical protein
MQDCSTGMKIPAHASKELITNLGLQSKKFMKWRNRNDCADWSAVAEEYFKKCASDGSIHGDDANEDFIAMGFTAEAAEEAKALFSDDYGHLFPWIWACKFLQGKIRYESDRTRAAESARIPEAKVSGIETRIHELYSKT